MAVTQWGLFKGREIMAKIYGEHKPARVNEWDKLLAENANTPTVYVFTSESCSFCSLAKPYVINLEEKYAKVGVEVMYIDVDKNKNITSDANVNGWPFFYFAKDGKVIGSDEGWADDQVTELERKLGLSETYAIPAGLGLPADAPSQQTSVCGDSAHQTAALAEGIQEMFAELEKKIEVMHRATQSHIDGVKSMVDMRLDAYEKMVGGKPCTCGKH